MPRFSPVDSIGWLDVLMMGSEWFVGVFRIAATGQVSSTVTGIKQTFYIVDSACHPDDVKTRQRIAIASLGDGWCGAFASKIGCVSGP
jgi:hypothetical protein